MLNKFRNNQFGEDLTLKQRIFDVFFGIVLPLLCFYFDPIVFQSDNGFGSPLLASYKAFAYSLSFGSIIIFAVWLCFGNRLKWLCAVFAGLFFTGAAFCFVIGVLLLPFSLLGLFLIIGILGFTPFFTGFVYLRNGFRAFRSAKENLNFKLLANAAVLSAVLSFVFPAILNLKTNQAISELINGDAQAVEASVKRLKYVSFFINSDEIAQAFVRTDDDEKRQTLAVAYKQLTGSEIVKRAERLND